MAQTVAAAKTQAASFVDKAKEYGFTWDVSHGTVVTVHKAFGANDAHAYIAAETDAYSILHHAPMLYPGTTWGTTSDGVGGHAGLTGGYFRLSKSGVSKRFIAALKKLG